MDREVLKEMEKALEGNKTLKTLTLSDGNDVTQPKEFCCHLMIGIGHNTSLSEVDLSFHPCIWHFPNDLSFRKHNWDCLRDGRLVYVSHMLCDSVGCSV